MRIVRKFDDRRRRTAQRIAGRMAACAVLMIGTAWLLASGPAQAADLDIAPNGPAYGPGYGPPGPPPYPDHPYPYRPHAWSEPPAEYAPPPRFYYRPYPPAYPPQAWNNAPPDTPRGRWAPNPDVEGRYADDHYHHDHYGHDHDGYGQYGYGQDADRDWDGGPAYRRPYGPYAQLPRPPAPIAGPPRGGWDGYPPEAPDDMIADEAPPPNYGWRGPPPRW
jgi:hypothetical protein